MKITIEVDVPMLKVYRDACGFTITDEDGVEIFSRHAKSSIDIDDIRVEADDFLLDTIFDSHGDLVESDAAAWRLLEVADNDYYERCSLEAAADEAIRKNALAEMENPSGKVRG